MARLVVYQRDYRVVISRNPEPAHGDDAIHVESVESAAGRGKDVAAALINAYGEIGFWVSRALALGRLGDTDDPVILRKWSDSAVREHEGMEIIGRGFMRVSLAVENNVVVPDEMVFRPVRMG